MRYFYVMILLLGLSASAAMAKPVVPISYGALRAETVAAVFKMGPQRFVAGLQVAPHLKSGRFVGFQIRRILPSSPLVNGAILPGDVIVRVNGESLERPEQFMRAWEVCQRAKAIEVRILRGEKPMDFVWKIEP